MTPQEEEKFSQEIISAIELIERLVKQQKKTLIETGIATTRVALALSDTIEALDTAGSAYEDFISYSRYMP